MENELRKVSFYDRSYRLDTIDEGYFHKFTTLSNGEYTEEYAIVEGSNGVVHQLPLDRYYIKFLDREINSVNDLPPRLD